MMEEYLGFGCLSTGATAGRELVDHHQPEESKSYSCNLLFLDTLYPTLNGDDFVFQLTKNSSDSNKTAAKWEWSAIGMDIAGMV